MLHLYLIRHAEAFEKASHQTDLQRELTAKGRSDASHLGNYLGIQKIKLDLILSSPAVRTQTTAQVIAASILIGTEKIISHPNLYHASPIDMLNIVKGIKNEFQHVAMVGHNPTISAFANIINAQKIDGFTPCTLAIIEFSQREWNKIDLNTGRLLLFKQPPIF
jgi:phosphohistidine phosphatase